MKVGFLDKQSSLLGKIKFTQKGLYYRGQTQGNYMKRVGVQNESNLLQHINFTMNYSNKKQKIIHKR